MLKKWLWIFGLISTIGTSPVFASGEIEEQHLVQSRKQVFSSKNVMEHLFMLKENKNSNLLFFKVEDIYNFLQVCHSWREAAWRPMAYIGFRLDCYSTGFLQENSEKAFEIYQSHNQNPALNLFKELVRFRVNIRAEIGRKGYTSKNTKLMVACELLGDDSATKTHISEIATKYAISREHDRLLKEVNELATLGSSKAIEYLQPLDIFMSTYAPM